MPALRAVAMPRTAVEDAGDLLDVLGADDERRRQLDDRISSVVRPADQACLEESRGEKASEQPLAFLVVERLPGGLVLHELDSPEISGAADVSHDRDASQ